AFWLMEGYFVRTLGMHRVYNSAFMNMLRDEDNAKYRSVLKNTLEFDPRIMKRYVNFMNNPDERTAVDQFGRGDKYFGICTLLSTMPGLPMFGHGQVEGYTEKYGMEYRRAYWNEEPDPHLVARHEREIFPLLHRRYLFADVEDFLLYDFFTPDGQVNEDVLAYSNRVGEEKALVIYHNRYAKTRGWIRTSVARAVKTEGGRQRLEQKSLSQGLELEESGDAYTIFRDHLTGLEYIRNNHELRDRGLYTELHAYQCHVFLSFRQVRDNEWHHYAQLAAYLKGRGVPSIDDALKEVLLQPVHARYRVLVNAELLRRIVEAPTQEAFEEVSDQVGQRMVALVQEIKAIAAGEGNASAIAQDTRRELQAVWHLADPERPSPLAAGVAEVLSGGALGNPSWYTLICWTFTHALGRAVSEADAPYISRSWIDEWLLGKIIASALQDLGLEEGPARWAVNTVKALTTHQLWHKILDEDDDAASRVLRSWLQDDEIQRFLHFNRYQDVLWFNKEAFEQLLWWMLVTAIAALSADADLAAEDFTRKVGACHELVMRLQAAADASQYRVERLLEIART
ncbi:MAG: alpha-amylase, partial [Anaerolineae bacterium]